jgi:hypothetical protein
MTMKEQIKISAGVDSFNHGRPNEQGLTRDAEGKEGKRNHCEKEIKWWIRTRRKERKTRRKTSLQPD